MDISGPIGKISDRVFDFAFDLGVRHVAYIVYCEQNIDELNGSVNDLRLEKDRVTHQCDEAEKNLRNIEGKVTEWLRKVGEFETEFDKFGNDAELMKTGLPHLKNRHKLGRRAKKMMVEVTKLINETPNFEEIAYMENITSNTASLSNAGYVEFSSRKSIIEGIMAQLQDSTVTMIGLHGPPGVGKSTLVREIANKARDKKTFHQVVLVEVTASPNLQKIQEEIAYKLGLKLEGEGENVRADHLRRRLSKKKDNILLILDDLWDKLDLNKLGIPLDDKLGIPLDDNVDELSKKTINNKQDINLKMDVGDYRGCKILLTSQDEKILTDKMDVKSTFFVKELDPDDALKLFQKAAEISDEMFESKKEQVNLKFCAGIPMAIVTLGRQLRGKDELVWKETQKKFKNQELGVKKYMELCIKMSYDHLESEELKSIFLLCAQMGHQPLVMDLVKYSFGLGILQGVNSLAEARELIDLSIEKLKGSNLLSDESPNNHFDIHDMIRDAALSIAHKEQNVFTLRNSNVGDWSELESCTSISICNSVITYDLPSVLKCPQLKFFQINSGDRDIKIPEGFFTEVKKLRVLILTGIDLSSLPPSIEFLSNLRMLCLEDCDLDESLSIIIKLKKLRIISFSRSQIKKFPTELGCLNELQLLDISNCFIMDMIPPNLSRLTSLEELYIRKSLIKMLAKGMTNQTWISFLSELKHLNQLKAVDLSIPCVAALPKDFLFDKLNDYKIVIGDFKVLSNGDFRILNKYEESRSLALHMNEATDSIHSYKGIKLLFKRVQNLLLGELNGVKNVIVELNLDGFPDLKQFSITNNSHIEYIFESIIGLPNPRDVFPKLESLRLHKLGNIKMICRGSVTNASFSKLKSIKVEMCVQLKNLFSFYRIHFLARLEAIDVSECHSLKKLIAMPENSKKIVFIKLQSLTLQSLPSFTSFCTIKNLHVGPHPRNEHAIFDGMVETPKLESLNLSSLNIHKIWSDQLQSSFHFQNLINLVVKDCDKLRYLCSLSVANGLRNLKSLVVSGCRMMEKLFTNEGNILHKVWVFPKLEEVHLSEMNRLTEIWPSEVSADSFSGLISVYIESCDRLDKIFPCHLEGWFATLDTLTVTHCESVEVIFEIKDSQQIDVSGGIDTNLQFIKVEKLPNLNQVWSTDPEGILNFKKLQGIYVGFCHKLRNVFPASMAKELQKLVLMAVGECDEIVEIFACEDVSRENSEPLVFPELSFFLIKLSNMKHFYMGKHPIECPKLKDLLVSCCDKLKIFPTENANEEEKSVLSAEKVFPNLEVMIIDFDQVQKWLSSNIVIYQMNRIKDLTLLSVKSGELIRQLLYRMPNLEKLQLVDNSYENLLMEPSVQCLGTVSQLKELHLRHTKIKDLGFQGDPILQRLEVLIITYCDQLSNLIPPSISLCYLTYLKVKFCANLKNLMASSTARSLVQLKTMKVIQCDLKEIITNEGNEDDDVEIVFSSLITIELVKLKKLTSFCSYKNCKIKFPSLEILIVRECPMMKTFSESDPVAPKLQNILSIKGNEEEKWQWEGDLNATIQKGFTDKVTFTYVEEMDLSDYPEFIEQLWHSNLSVQQDYFHNLKILTAEGCDTLVHVIPSHLIPCFQNLEVLKVSNCSKAQVIFNINEIKKTKSLGITRLKILYLSDLPELRHVLNKGPEGIIDLQVLECMRVENCGCLKSLFPETVAKDLKCRFEVLYVSKCKALVEIFSKDEKGTEEATKEFVFGCLTAMTLNELPELKYFYPGSHTLEWPMLEELDAHGCELVKLTCKEEHPEEQVLIQIEEVKVIQFRSLNILGVCIGDTHVGWVRKSGLLYFKKLQHFQEESDSALLYRFLCLLPRIEKLSFNECFFENMLSKDRPNDGYTRILLHLKELKFNKMDNLKSIGLEQQPLAENLQTIEVNDCPCLENLEAPFSKLTRLEVSSCKSVQYMFTSSTAKGLAQLESVKIQGCDSLRLKDHYLY